MEPFIYLIYNLLLLLFSPFILLAIFIRYPQTFFKYFFTGLAMRLGQLRSVQWDSTHRPIWIHAASLGECRASVPLVKAIKEKYPDIPIVFSSATVNGIDEIKRLHLSDTSFFSPIDIPWILKTVIRRIQPRMILLLESEIWPNWLRMAKGCGIPVGIANGRISQKSAGRYFKVRWFSKILMDKIDFICAREKTDAERFQMIGMSADKIMVTGNLKFDLVPDVHFSLTETTPSIIWTAGSVREGEETIILNCFMELRKKYPQLKLIIAPRHLDHIPYCAEQIKNLNFAVQYRSNDAEVKGKWDVLLWDTFGNLLEAYETASIVFVGGSLVPKGGQNPIEPAWYAKPILFGPHMENFAEPAKTLLEWKGAIQVPDEANLNTKMDELLAQPSEMRTLGENAKKCVESFCGQATRKTMAVLEKYLERQTA